MIFRGIVYVSAIVAAIIPAAVYATIGIEQVEYCRAAAYTDVVLYFAVRICLYSFMLERLHIVRQAQHPGSRWRDWLWVLSFAICAVTIVVVVINVFLRGFLFVEDHQVCLMEVPDITSFIVVGMDVFLTLSLTIVFVVLLVPSLSFSTRIRAAFSSEESMTTGAGSQPEERRQRPKIWTRSQALEYRNSLVGLVVRTCLGSLVISMAILANLVVLLRFYHGHEPATSVFTGLAIDSKWSNTLLWRQVR